MNPQCEEFQEEERENLIWIIVFLSILNFELQIQQLKNLKIQERDNKFIIIVCILCMEIIILFTNILKQIAVKYDIYKVIFLT